jgi:nitroreductase
VEFTEVIKRRRMVRAFTDEPLAAGVTEHLLRAANRAPSAGFSQGYSVLVLEGKEQCAPLWELVREADAGEDATEDADPGQRSGRRSGPSREATPIRTLIQCRPHGRATASPWNSWPTAATGS